MIIAPGCKRKEALSPLAPSTYRHRDPDWGVAERDAYPCKSGTDTRNHPNGGQLILMCELTIRVRFDPARQHSSPLFWTSVT